MPHISIVIGILISVFATFFSKTLSYGLVKNSILGMTSPTSSARLIINIFAIIAFTLMAVSVYRDYDLIIKNIDTIIFGCWLMAAIILGMFVQVTNGNYKAGNSLMFDITASQLLYPLFFSIIVFYPTWLSSLKASDPIFPFYLAFLNGYYWKDILSNSKYKNRRQDND
ncbi:hypothetical protein [Dyadobacter sp. NIV53]|uniref:hypothetical protein n=1 Tax=Dyadobacter sp. NIV53 TaxID=2861765 RepID=UPI001C88B3C6|nr:hypothetical protein [Dyadobacter sp. NIV53]